MDISAGRVVSTAVSCGAFERYDSRYCFKSISQVHVHLVMNIRAAFEIGAPISYLMSDELPLRLCAPWDMHEFGAQVAH